MKNAQLILLLIKTIKLLLGRDPEKMEVYSNELVKSIMAVRSEITKGGRGYSGCTWGVMPLTA